MVKDRYELKKCCLAYKIIFMDLNMSIQDGFKTTKNILSYLKDKNVTTYIFGLSAAYTK